MSKLGEKHRIPNPIGVRLQSFPRLRPPSAAGRAEETSPDAVLFTETRPHHCRWPLWNDATPVLDRMVCGAHRHDMDNSRDMYCAAHSARAHQ